jgi:uncharacterized protein
MSANKQIIERHLTSPNRSESASLLADDVEWTEWVDGVPAAGARTVGKAAYIQNSGADQLRIEIRRMTEENNVVVAEGTAHVHRQEGPDLRVEFCDIFELENGKIRRKASFGALVKEPA